MNREHVIDSNWWSLSLVPASSSSFVGCACRCFFLQYIILGEADDHSPSGLRSNTIIIGPGRLVIQHMALKYNKNTNKNKIYWITLAWTMVDDSVIHPPRNWWRSNSTTTAHHKHASIYMYTSHSEFLTDGACTKDRALSVSVPSADDELAATAAGCKKPNAICIAAVKTIWLRCNNRKTRINSSRLAAWPLHRDQIERLNNIYQEVIKPVSCNRRMVNKC